MLDYNAALKLATERHKGQLRKISLKDYISHPIAVADKFKNENYKIVSILHDTIEDTNLTLEELRRLRLDEKLIFAINILTRKESQTYLNYILRCKSYEMTKLIKIEDIKYNLSDNPTSKCSEDKYLMALYILEN